jgi:putative pyruvate formate lyase activating enzyme
MMLDLQDRGCHNINFVSPSHVSVQIIEAVEQAKAKGLSIPLIYNSNGYDSVETLRMLEGVIDIYMPDCKYSSNEISQRLSDCPDYWDKVRPALEEMHRQVGLLAVDKKGVAKRGLLIRHLVLPDDLSGSFAVLRFVAETISQKTQISVMAQYHPCYKAASVPEISRPISRKEYDQVLAWVNELGLENVFRQELTSANQYLPDFNNDDPFEESR